MYWHQGFGQANMLVQQCVASWRYHNPDWEIKLVDQFNVHDYISPLDIPDDKLLNLRVQHRSDLIRTKLLIAHGGVWADPTCFCMRPLSEWIEDHLQAGFFFFHRPGRDRVLANWFIAVSHKSDPFLTKLYRELCKYWSTFNFRNHVKDYSVIEGHLERVVNRSLTLSRLWLTPVFTRVARLYPYMIYHYMAYKLISTDNDCKKLWSKMPKVSALGPPRLQRLGLLSPVNDEAKELIDAKEIPLFKLKWNLDVSKIQPGTILHYLFSTLQ